MFHILLDAEVFRREHLHFGSKRFNQLAEFAANHEATVYLTDVTIGEVRRAIATAVVAAFDLLSKKNRDALGILVQTDKAGLSGLLRLPERSALIEQLNTMFDQLVTDLKAVTLSTDRVSIAELRRRYFEALPPFATLAAKRHEFPDALAVLAAEAHARSSGIVLHVVSADKRLAEAAKLATGLEPVETLAAMTTRIHETLAATANVATAAEGAFIALKQQIVARVTELFEASGLNVEDEWEGEAEEVHVTEIDLGDASIDEIEGTTVTLGFLAAVSFTAEVTVADPDQTAYDSETGETMVFGYLTKTVTTTEHDVEGTVQIEVDTDEPAASAILDVSLFADDISVRFPWPSW